MKLGKHQKAMLNFILKYPGIHSIAMYDGKYTWRVAKRLSERNLLKLTQIGESWFIEAV